MKDKNTTTHTPAEMRAPFDDAAPRQTFAEALRLIEEARAELPPEPVRAYDRAESLYTKLKKAKTPEERENVKKQIRKAHEDAAAVDALRLRVNIKIQLLKHNAKIALYNEVAPAVVETLKKYNGKPYGEKTREKIRAELKEKTSCYIWLKFDEWSASPADRFGRDFDLQVYTTPDAENNGRNRIITNENKINALPLDAFKLYYMRGGTFTSPSEDAAEALRLFKEATRKWEEYRAAVAAFNAYAVGNIEPLDPFKNPRAYIM